MPEARISGERYSCNEWVHAVVLVSWQEPDKDTVVVTKRKINCGNRTYCKNPRIPAGQEVRQMAGSLDITPEGSHWCSSCYQRLPTRVRLLRNDLRAWDRQTITTLAGHTLDTTL